MTKKQLLSDRQLLLDEIAGLHAENLRLRLRDAAQEDAPAVPGDMDEQVTPQSEFSRFPLLRAVDESCGETSAAEEAPQKITLLQTADHLRKYAAAHFGIYAGRGLYAHFLGAMAASGLVLLRSADENRGPLLLCQAVAAAMGQKIALTTVQTGWSGPANLLGAPDPATKLYRETAFLRTLYAAGYEPGPCFAALDHAAAAPSNGYLSALLPALGMAHALSDGPGRRVALADAAWPGDPVLLREGALPFPENLWLFGALHPGDPPPDERLRGAAMEFCMPALPPKSFLVALTQPLRLSARGLRERFASAREVFVFPPEALELFRRTAQYLADHLDLSLGAAAEPQLLRFGSVCMACGLRPAEILDGFLFHRALRRLEAIDPAVLKYELPGLRRHLDEAIGKRELPLTFALLEKM